MPAVRIDQLQSINSPRGAMVIEGESLGKDGFLLKAGSSAELYLLLDLALVGQRYTRPA